MTGNDNSGSSKEPTFMELVEYLKVLSEGYVKPDLAKDSRTSNGLVRDTKKYFDHIDAVNNELCQRAGIKLNNNIERTEID